ncbi:hypothetical protein [Bacillus solitudinis]|uniref:hypothetical protein n=1 Tax=Bacillus solitudinis TaxID=2014074 RepID=UPI000C248C4B|nr:hypothetical protein [Bacillus solitudinis]
MNVVVGPGRLGLALIHMMKKENVWLYGRTLSSVNKIIQQYKHVKSCSKKELRHAKRLFVCLPQNAYQSFFQEHAIAHGVEIYHFATALNIESVKKMTGGNIIPCKLVGHANQMKEDNQGLFVIPEQYKLYKGTVKRLFPNVRIVTGEEMEAFEANKLATEASVTMMIQLEQRMREAGLSKELVSQSLSQTVRGVTKAYVDNDLGGFAKRIVEEKEKDE